MPKIEYGTAKRFNTQFDRLADPGELNTLPSETQPNDTLSVQEIIERYTRGVPINQRESFDFYDLEDDVSDMDDMDFAQRQEWLQERRKHIENLIKANEQKIKKKDSPLEGSEASSLEAANGEAVQDNENSGGVS